MDFVYDMNYLIQFLFFVETLGRSGGSLSMPPNKRHKTSNGEPMKTQPAFVMKLFDRGVDLAQFDDSTPLYPICRAWIQNKPHA